MSKSQTIYKYMDINNEIPEHENITNEEFQFLRRYISKFGFKKTIEIDVPFILVFPHTFSNMALDVIRDYENYKSETKNDKNQD